jgi:hypothetical protein
MVHVCVRRCSRCLATSGGVVGDESACESTWRTAKRCDTGACVEIGTLGEAVHIRNSADQDGMRLTLSHNEWQEFVAGVKDGDFDGL